ncbi:ABC transporter ATP-binding protein [Paenibacillus alkalitolerans]|uniref:ABC transporter ATP-binding protein n=1 Tax=Paenibacillus alkalitolerans TaxID=2799335 RepID=UPI0018F59EE6|nr:ABC transporter ATP-binding protein [Paenibacillus alkalitolerans]
MVETPRGMQSLVHGIDFELRPGRVLGLVGESGSGKTMTCLSIMQLHDRKTMCVEGGIRLNGRELNGLRAEEMRRIRGKEMGFIMQNPMNAFSPVFSIGNQFVETIRAHTAFSKKQSLELAASALQDVNLPDPFMLMRKYPFELSGGMLQRAMIALAMCLRPSLIIADEPTTALDTANQLQVLCLLERIRTEYGTAILLISHDLGVIAEMADEVAVMQRGEIVEKADVYELFDHPKHPYTKQLMEARPTLQMNERIEELVMS